MLSAHLAGVSSQQLRPDDPTPRGYDIDVPVPGSESVEARIDLYSDRLRCDHPTVDDGESLGRALRDAAEATNRARVMVLAEDAVAPGLEAVGYAREAVLPGFYRGVGDCVALAYGVDTARSEEANPREVARVDALLDEAPAASRPRPKVRTGRADPEDAPEIADLIAETFDCYPTPSGDPDYIASAIEGGTPFRVVKWQSRVVACASADLIPEAKTAELTDCATRPEWRGKGLMQAILLGLMDDLREMGYPTAFTLARARIPGVNLAFQRLSFELRGRMASSCRIGDGLEDMNVWSRRL